MITTTFVLLLVLFIVVSVTMVLVILVQRPQGGGLASAFGGAGGGGSDTVFGGRVGDALTTATVIIFVLFLASAVGLNLLDNPDPDAVAPEAATITGEEDPLAEDPDEFPDAPAEPGEPELLEEELPEGTVDQTDPPIGDLGDDPLEELDGDGEE